MKRSCAAVDYLAAWRAQTPDSSLAVSSSKHQVAGPLCVLAPWSVDQARPALTRYPPSHRRTTIWSVLHSQASEPYDSDYSTVASSPSAALSPSISLHYLCCSACQQGHRIPPDEIDPGSRYNRLGTFTYTIPDGSGTKCARPLGTV